MKYFIIVRILDVITTLYGLRHGQYEFNPTQDWLISKGALWFVAWNALIIYVVSMLYKYRLIRITVNIFTIINALVVFSNVALILLVYLFERGVI